MTYTGIKTRQKPNFEYIQEIDNSWYFLDETHTYSSPYESYDKAKEELLDYYKKSNAKLLLSEI